MSRYALEALDPELVVWVGWDEPLSSFFLQVEPPGLGEPDDLSCGWGPTAARSPPPGG